jgi:hypothetical protein
MHLNHRLAGCLATVRRTDVRTQGKKGMGSYAKKSGLANAVSMYMTTAYISHMFSINMHLNKWSIGRMLDWHAMIACMLMLFLLNKCDGV